MTAEEFVQALARAEPSPDELLRIGLSEDELEGIQQVFRCVPVVPPPAADASNELVRLLLRYDCSKVAVREVRLAGCAVPHARGTLVAWAEADPIVVTEAGEVIALDHADESSVLFRCAADGSRFLEAVACVANAVANRALWRGRAAELVAHCARLAGGPEYAKFFWSMCGGLDR